MATYREQDATRIIPLVETSPGVWEPDSGTGSAAAGTQQERFDIGATTIYVGYAERGEATSDPVWTIKRISLDSSGNPTDTKWTDEAAATWDDRASETYT